MSNAYGAGSPQASLNAPGGMPSWLSNLWNYVNPMAQATAGGVDAQGRPQDAITAAQQALAAQALNSGPQQSGPVARSQAGNVSTAPTLGGNNVYPPNVVNAVNAGGTPPIMGPQFGQSTFRAADIPTDATLTAPSRVAAYVGGTGQGPFAGRPTETPPAGVGQGPFAGRPAAVNPHARQQAQVAAAAPQVSWLDPKFERPNLPAGNGPLGRNAQRQMGVIDFSKLFNRSS